MDKETLLKMLEDFEYDYYIFPHYGLCPDWREWYWKLHEAVYEYLKDEV